MNTRLAAGFRTLGRIVGWFFFQVIGGLCFTLGWRVNTDAIPLWRFVAVWVVATLFIEIGARFRTLAVRGAALRRVPLHRLVRLSINALPTGLA